VRTRRNQIEIGFVSSSFRRSVFVHGKFQLTAVFNTRRENLGEHFDPFAVKTNLDK